MSADAKEAIEALVSLGKDLAEQLVARRAEDRLKQKLTFRGGSRW